MTTTMITRTITRMRTPTGSLTPTMGTCTATSRPAPMASA